MVVQDLPQRVVPQRDVPQSVDRKTDDRVCTRANQLRQIGLVEILANNVVLIMSLLARI